LEEEYFYWHLSEKFILRKSKALDGAHTIKKRKRTRSQYCRNMSCI